MLVQPPRRKIEFLGDCAGLVQDDPVGHEESVDVPGDSDSVVSQSHGGPADDEQVGDNSAADEPFTQNGERAFQLGSAQ
ncbi:hypothetical protein ACGFNU_05575 [Spirillospora sp. NPDC048911]|uniref:hypothetical protein n=1 Tax=Spirillospora sp. NPDC048911 TaxID=3364527 RepID=UPI0037113C0E